MMLEPWLHAGKPDFAQAAARPGAEPANIVGNFDQRAGVIAQSAAEERNGIFGGLGFKVVFGASTNGSPVTAPSSRMVSAAKPAGAFRPVPIAVPPSGSS